MTLITLLGRVTDGMPLVGSSDPSSDIVDFTKRAKDIIRTLSHQSPTRCSIKADSMIFHYIIEDNVCYLTLTQESYPRQLAYQFLEAVQAEFQASHGARVNFFSRPYQAVVFEPALNRIRRDFIDPRAPKNLAKLNDNLTDIHHIMKKNIEEVLQRGEKLDSIGKKATSLATDSKQFKKQAEWARWMSEMQKYVPVLVIALLLIIVIYWKLRV